MIDLEHLWPDEDRRDDALYRVALAIGRCPPERTAVHAGELRALQASSFGLDADGVSVVLGLSLETIKTQLKTARRALRAKNTTHACCEALRQGLIR
jgi:DNA-binding CsgD family transcriptional regulator